MLKDHYDYEPYFKWKSPERFDMSKLKNAWYSNLYDGSLSWCQYSRDEYMCGKNKEEPMKYKVEKEISLLTIAQSGPKGCGEFKDQYNNLIEYWHNAYPYADGFIITDRTTDLRWFLEWAEKNPKRLEWLIKKGFLSRVGELKPCPFCGSKNLQVCHTLEYKKRRFVACDDCDAEGPIFSTKERAAGAWNRRAG